MQGLVRRLDLPGCRCCSSLNLEWPASNLIVLDALVEEIAPRLFGAGAAAGAAGGGRMC